MRKHRGETTNYVLKDEATEAPAQDDNQVNTEKREKRGQRSGKFQKKFQEKKFVKKGENEDVNKEDQPTNNKEKPQRKQREKPDDSWKKEIEDSMTVDTKIPAYPAKEDLLSWPDRTQYRNNLDDMDKKIEDIQIKIEDLHEERKTIKKSIMNKNKKEFEELRKWMDERKKIKEVVDQNNEAIEILQKEKESLREKKEKLKKKAYNGKIMGEEQLTKIIKNLEDNFKNAKHTATEEKRYIEEVERLKACFPLSGEFEGYKNQIRSLDIQIDVLYKKIKPTLAERKKVGAQIKEIQERLDSQKETNKNMTAEEKEAEK